MPRLEDRQHARRLLKMSDDPPRSAEVLIFGPRKEAAQAANKSARPSPSVGPVPGLADFENGRGGDDYRHRMLVNVAVFAVAALLVLGGIWLAIQIADLRKAQDCVLSGRRNCATIVVPEPAGR